MGRKDKLMNVSLAVTSANGPKLNIPPNLPRQGKRGKRDIVHVVLPDPMQRGDRQLTAVNLNHDVLEAEYKRDRLHKAAYDAGRALQSDFEAIEGKPVSGGQLTEASRGDPSTGATNRMAAHLDKTWAANNRIGRAKGIVGERPFLILRRALLLKMTFEENAQAHFGGRHVGRHQIWFVAETFRTALEDLAKRARGA
jgi:hypothetical protein